MRAFLCLSCLLLALTGCSELSVEYGESKGVRGRTSLNGFGALRTAYENAGYRSRDISQLSDRVMLTDVIVWTPNVAQPIDASVTKWFEKWFGMGGKTLVYLPPDSGSEADYWEDAMMLAPPSQRMEYRRRLAREVNQQIAWRLNRNPVPSNGWFHLEPLKKCRESQPIGGPWFQKMERMRSELEAESRDEDQVFSKPKQVNNLLAEPDRKIRVEYDLLASTDSRSVAIPPSMPRLSADSTKATGPGFETASGFAIQNNYEMESTATSVNFTPLLSSDDSNPLAVKIHAKPWKDSRIILLAGGSLLTNFAFTRPLNQQLAEQVIKTDSRSKALRPVVGFLKSGWDPIRVSEEQTKIPKVTGMEILTEWPLNLITMHGVLLGGIACLIMLPILGRPRKVIRDDPTDFSHHLDAVAALMRKAKGESYAKQRIDEYAKKVQGESVGRRDVN